VDLPCHSLRPYQNESEGSLFCPDEWIYKKKLKRSSWVRGLIPSGSNGKKEPNAMWAQCGEEKMVRNIKLLSGIGEICM